MDQHRAFKEALYEQFARVGKALANPHRLELLDLLAQTERSVENLAREAHLSVANASQHLQTLRAAGLIEARRDGTFVRYRLAGDNVFALWRALRDTGESRLGDVTRVITNHLGERGAVETISVDALRERLERGGPIVLDVRPEEEFRAGHIPGARNVPLERLDAAIANLPRDREVIAYCRGPHCVFADDAVRRLRDAGFDARRLDVGLPDWRAAGFPVRAGR